MDSFAEKYAIKAYGRAFESNIIADGNIRITVITPQLIRIEKSENGKFCDLPTQTVLFRDLGQVDFTQKNEKDTIVIETSKCIFGIGKSGRLSKVRLADGRTVTDFNKGNLKGTRRTLDVTFGRVKLGDGIISRCGAAIMNDSDTLTFAADGTLAPREACETDVYIFAYGNEYRAALRDFYRITGETPLIPRFCLGNWWSRYWAYTQEKYLALMDRFKAEKIPLTVACVDMDWHWTDVAERFGDKAKDYPKPKNPIAKITGCFLNPGWTGYSWNTELFPDYRKFLDELHDRGFKVNLNIHPAQGVRFFEDMYADFADFMGVDKDKNEPVNFDFTDKKYIEGHFKFINEPLENDGVDFWWLDWQQGSKSRVPGLDPLWLINHYYCLDRERKGLRPLTLSRFAGFGSHRYPLGFSGDAAVRWSVLDFQPYFTATASNAGYSWWSHDIGGHNFGRRDDELYLRWLQFGVFSPIMRFHSVKDAFMGKEPWKFSGAVEMTAKKFLRLRHRMIPYTYSMNRKTQLDGSPLLAPMYYDYPEKNEAYEVPNEYFFGTELIAAPVTEKVDKITNTAAVKVWLPEGRYTDIFSGRIYRGGKTFFMCRDTTQIPVLAKEGAIIPLDGRTEGNDCGLPDTLEILVYRGNGRFTLYEDDGETLAYRNGAFAETDMTVQEIGDEIIFEISPVRGDAAVVPEERNYKIVFCDVCAAGETETDGKSILSQQAENGALSVNVASVKAESGIRVKLSKVTVKKNPTKKELLTQLLSKVQGDIFLKNARYKKCLDDDFDGRLKAPKAVRYAVEEVMNME